MSKGKKSNKNKIEKLRRILDNPDDPEIKKSVSKDNGSLETIHRKLLHAKKSDNLEPIAVVHTKEKKIAKTKQSEATEQPDDVKNKKIEEELFKAEDSFEVEKVDVSKPEFLEIKSKEITKEIEPEKIISEEKPPLDRKDKMVVFQEAELDEIYSKTKKGLLSSDKIQMYKPITIFEMWAFTIILGGVAISGLFLMRDWLFLNFGVYGDKFIPTPEGTQNIHIWFGFALVVLGLLHIAIHIFSKKKDILPKQTLRDFKAFLHSGMYLIGLARREGYDASGRFYGRQRIIYLALVYILGLTILTGLLYYMNFLSNDLSMVHVIPAGLSIMVLLFHFLITIRKHDTIALKCAFITGKLPRWYVRKNHPVWYKKTREERESTLRRLPQPITTQANVTLIEGGNDLTNAILKFTLLLNKYPDEEDIKAVTEELQDTIHPDMLKRIIELAEELKDEPEEEIEQTTEEESQQNKEEPTSFEESSDKKEES